MLFLYSCNWDPSSIFRQLVNFLFKTLRTDCQVFKFNSTWLVSCIKRLAGMFVLAWATLQCHKLRVPWAPCAFIKDLRVSGNWTGNCSLCTGCRLRKLREQQLERCISDLICTLEWQSYSINFRALLLFWKTASQGSITNFLAGFEINKREQGKQLALL